MKKKMIPFLCGCLVGALCVSTALAGASYSGRISFDTNSLYLNGHEVIAAGQSMTTEAGAEVPSSILYTDENGGGTFYVPVRPLAHALDMPAKWEDDAVLWKIEGELAVNLMSVTGPSVTYNGCVQEVTAVVPEEGHKLLSPVHHGVENFDAELDLDPEKGNTVSITVTHHDSSNLVFKLGVTEDDAPYTTSTKIPAGQTVTRTLRLLEDASSNLVPYLNIGNAEDVFRENNFTVNVVQFDAEYPEP